MIARNIPISMSMLMLMSRKMMGINALKLILWSYPRVL